MSENTIIGRTADWVAATQFADLPRRVVEEAKNQILSVIASVHAGHFSDAGRIVSRTVKEWAGGKEATLIPSGERTSVHYAVFGNAALSMALDYDDYLFAGHAGHSSVLVPLALSERIGVSGQEFVLAQVLANEVGGRVAAATLPGPGNGQMCSFIHLIGAAVSAAKLMKLERNQTENALGIAMLQPNFALPAGFYGSDAKALLASMTAPVGIQAAELAANGMRGANDAFESENGFLQVFARNPLPEAFSSFGKVWLSETLSYKVFPGCTHLAACIDCVLSITRQHHLDARKVRAVEVAAGPQTLAMEALSKPYLKGAESAASTLNFSLAYNVAVALLDREVSPRQFSRDRIKDAAVWDLASRVRLTLDDEMARRAIERSPLKATTLNGETRYSLDLAGTDLTALKNANGARVRIEMEDGRVFEMEQESPNGSGARPFDDRRKAVEDKFRRETRYTLRKERMEKAIDLIHHLEDAGAAQLRELVRLCCSEKV